MGRPKTYCKVCGESKGMQQGYCFVHAYHFKRYGDPLKYADKPEHGKSGHELYHVWLNMIRRATNPNKKDILYKERGIGVSDRWRYGEDNKAGFVCFLEDMGERPEGTSLDRKDNDKGYSPENCRWATPREQSLNTRRSIKERNVYYMKHRDLWYTQIMVDRKLHYGGAYKEKAEAIIARDLLEEKLRLIV